MGHLNRNLFGALPHPATVSISPALREPGISHRRIALLVLEVGEESRDPAGNGRATAEAPEFVNRLPKSTPNLATRRGDELLEDRAEWGQPPLQVKPGKHLRSPIGKFPPVLDRAFERDGWDTTEGEEHVLEITLHRIEQHDFRSDPFRRTRG